MGYVEGQIAKQVNRFRSRRGVLWARRFSAEPIRDEASAWDKLCYLYLNPVRANLADHCRDWMGFHTLRESFGKPARCYTYLDKAAYRVALCKDPEARKKDFEQTHVLRVHPLPGFEGEPEEFASRLRARLRSDEAELRAERRAAGQEIMPLEHILSTDPTDAPSQPKCSPRPLCHAATKAARAAYREIYRAFCNAYRLASAAFRAGDLKAAFPEFAFRPPPPPQPAFG
jgi:hypothetical protein